MSYNTLEVGRTGPAGRIGVGTEYHIDSKYLRSSSWEDKVKAFDAKANRYSQDGRNIVFSNQGVHGSVYNPSASLEDKVDLLKRVDAAHSHSVHDDWNSFDYYAPIGTDIYDKSAENAPIYVAGPNGLKVEGHQGSGWGNSGIVIGPDGNPIGKTGHGDTNVSMFSGGVLGGEGATFTPANVDGNSSQVKAKEKAQSYQNMSKASLDSAYDAMRSDPAKAESEGMKMHKAFFNKK